MHECHVAAICTAQCACGRACESMNVVAKRSRFHMLSITVSLVFSSARLTLHACQLAATACFRRDIPARSVMQKMLAHETSFGAHVFVKACASKERHCAAPKRICHAIRMQKCKSVVQDNMPDACTFSLDNTRDVCSVYIFSQTHCMHICWCARVCVCRIRLFFLSQSCLCFSCTAQCAPCAYFRRCIACIYAGVCEFV